MGTAAKAAAADLAVALSGRLHVSVLKSGLKLGGTAADPDPQWAWDQPVSLSRVRAEGAVAQAV
jgi:hypothetical protein